MKFFLDTAIMDEIRQARDIGLLDGVTTNPTLMARANRDPRKCLEEICGEVDGPVSAEVIAADYEGMIKEARELAGIANNIVIKLPVGLESLKATRTLKEEGIPVNMTLIFSSSQALLSAKAGAAYVSPFVGRLDDISQVGMDVVEDIVTIFENYEFDTEIIVASVRNPLHVVEAALMGANIATVPLKVFRQLVEHPLTDKGIQLFYDDWKSIGKK